MTEVIGLPLQERGPPNLGFGNMTGGFMMGGQAGTLKMTLPAAFTISMLAWSMLEFPQVCPPGSPHAVASPLQTPQHQVIVAGLLPSQLAETEHTCRVALSDCCHFTQRIQGHDLTSIHLIPEAEMVV